MDNRENYNKSAQYETFLRRAFQFDKRLFDPSNQEYLNLIEAENENKHHWLPNREKQLETIKKRVTRAIELLLKQNLDKMHRDNLRLLLPEIEKAATASDIFIIIKAGLENSQKLIE